MHALIAQGKDIRGTLDTSHDARYFLGLGIQHGKLGAIELHRHIPAHTRQHFGHAHLDRLSEAISDAGNGIQYLANLLDQLALVFDAPFRLRLQHHKSIGFIQPHGVQADFIRAHPCRDPLHFGYMIKNRFLDLAIHSDRLLQIDGGQLFHLNDDVALVHGRHERLADQGIDVQRRQQQRTGKQQNHAGMGQAPDQNGSVDRQQGSRQPGLLVTDLRHQKGGQHRNDQQGKDQGPGHGKDVGKGDGLE